MYCCTRRHNTTTVSNFASDVPLFICNSIVLNIEHSNRRTACCSTVCSHNRIASHRIALHRITITIIYHIPHCHKI